MEDTLAAILCDNGLLVTAQADLPEVLPRHAAVPERLHPVVRKQLRAAHPAGLFAHQSAAIDAILDGEHVCLATPTASGKSQIFMSAATSLLLADPSRRVLALYPLKALIEDQVAKWSVALEGTGLTVGRIDGSVPVGEREQIMASSHVVAMTPDVLHAWAMPRLSEPVVNAFVKSLAVILIDEAHVYDGVFGSNVAYLMRRLRAHAAGAQIIAATATIGEPATLMKRVTGCEARVFDTKDDGSGRHARRILAACPARDASSEALGRVVAALASKHEGRFLVFVDSRQGVERVGVAAAGDTADDGDERPSLVMTTRAGHDDEVRAQVLRDLAGGNLRGVVTTSALEMGIDIGPIDLVVCVGVPFTMKSFLQRLGRAGRRSVSSCVIIDMDGRLSSDRDLQEFLAQEPEPSWLYLDNRYLQYAQAICAAHEMRQVGMKLGATRAFDDLPAEFIDLLAQELDGGQFIAKDLYHLKSRTANTTPHYEFPIRMSAEQSFEIRSHHSRLGSITFSQLMREAYPGATYLHQMRHYVVTDVDVRRGVVKVRAKRQGLTRPCTLSTVFPNLRSGILRARVGPAGFVAEVELQATDCVSGFSRRVGRQRVTELYAPGSAYRQQPLNRFVESTGVCFCFPALGLKRSEWDHVAKRIADASCELLALHPGDVAAGRFHARESVFGLDGPLRGGCVFDGTYGSLRLTGRTFDVLDALLTRIIADLGREGRDGEVKVFEALAEAVAATTTFAGGDAPHGEQDPPAEGGLLVIAPGSKGVLRVGACCDEVVVKSVLYTPNGIMYELEAPPTPMGVAAVRHLVAASSVEALNGESEMRLFDPFTAELRPLA